MYDIHFPKNSAQYWGPVHIEMLKWCNVNIEPNRGKPEDVDFNNGVMTIKSTAIGKWWHHCNMLTMRFIFRDKEDYDLFIAKWGKIVPGSMPKSSRDGPFSGIYALFDQYCFGKIDKEQLAYQLNQLPHIKAKQKHSDLIKFIDDCHLTVVTL